MSDTDLAVAAKRFRSDYAAQRLAEGRAHTAAELATLPYLSSGPLARQWGVRARSFDALVRTVLLPARARQQDALAILDLGAGCGWLSYRAGLAGYTPVALDIRDDSVDGLGAAAFYLNDDPELFQRIVGSFDALPLASSQFDIAVFNASIHYSFDLTTVLNEAIRVVRAGGQIVILDSPFYPNETAGDAMISEKRRDAVAQFGARARTLLAFPFVEFLTPQRLSAATAALGLVWRRHRVWYPLWYEARPTVARLRGRRSPSRFDLWECTVP